MPARVGLHYATASFEKIDGLIYNFTLKRLQQLFVPREQPSSILSCFTFMHLPIYLPSLLSSVLPFLKTPGIGHEKFSE